MSLKKDKSAEDSQLTKLTNQIKVSSMDDLAVKQKTPPEEKKIRESSSFLGSSDEIDVKAAEAPESETKTDKLERSEL